jgi:L-alanine-DL-glutamate epimerase-like enolase superfamily enzyme
MVQPDIVKMGGITGMLQCAAVAHAQGVQLVPHQTQPSIGHLANIHMLSTIMHLSKPVELADGWERASSVFKNPSEPVDGRFTLPTTPGLGYEYDEQEMKRRTIAVA